MVDYDAAWDAWIAADAGAHGGHGGYKYDPAAGMISCACGDVIPHADPDADTGEVRAGQRDARRKAQADRNRTLRGHPYRQRAARTVRLPDHGGMIRRPPPQDSGAA